MNRRTLLATAALAPLAACGIVTKATTNGVTTVTVNVAKVDAYGQAFLSAVNLIAGLPGIPTAASLPIKALSPIIAADLAAFDKQAAGQLNLTFDATSVPGALWSLLDDGKTLFADGQKAIEDAKLGPNAQEYVQAVETLVTLLKAMLVGVGQTAAAVAPGAETHALAVLGVK